MEAVCQCIPHPREDLLAAYRVLERRSNVDHHAFNNGQEFAVYERWNVMRQAWVLAAIRAGQRKTVQL